MLLTALLLPGICFTVMFLLNFIAVGYNTSNVIPFSVMVSLVSACTSAAPRQQCTG